jgi:hypothetical protein
MLGNIEDKRTDSTNPDVDAVFEPSIHDNARRADGTDVFDWDQATKDPAYFHATSQEDTTVREAVMRAEQAWPFPVTVYLWDKGSRPLGEFFD